MKVNQACPIQPPNTLPPATTSQFTHRISHLPSPNPTTPQPPPRFQKARHGGDADSRPALCTWLTPSRYENRTPDTSSQFHLPHQHSLLANLKSASLLPRQTSTLPFTRKTPARERVASKAKKAQDPFLCAQTNPTPMRRNANSQTPALHPRATARRSRGHSSLRRVFFQA